ncbi:unnamed protein product [Urochloa humidicola]
MDLAGLLHMRVGWVDLARWWVLTGVPKDAAAAFVVSGEPRPRRRRILVSLLYLPSSISFLVPYPLLDRVRFDASVGAGAGLAAASVGGARASPPRLQPFQHVGRGIWRRRRQLDLPLQPFQPVEIRIELMNKMAELPGLSQM